MGGGYSGVVGPGQALRVSLRKVVIRVMFGFTYDVHLGFPCRVYIDSSRRPSRLLSTTCDRWHIVVIYHDDDNYATDIMLCHLITLLCCYTCMFR